MMLMFLATCLCVILSVKAPLTAALGLVCMSILMGMLMSAFVSKWTLFLVILLFTGGMMVLFVYVTSLTCGTKPWLSLKTSHFTMISLVLALSAWAGQSSSFGSSKSMWISSLFTEPSSGLMLFAAFYLLTLLVLSMMVVARPEGTLKSPINEE